MHYPLTPDCTGGVCPVETTLNLISGKWKGIILYRLLSGKKRFGELKKIIPAITFRTLTLQLRQMEQDGIVERTVYAEVPPRVEYALTDLGKSMKPIIQSMCDWGTNYQKRVDQTGNPASN
ncbi:winged helix-turn-helix transcriptional regulator [Ethanoligenens harbinense]|uniref:Transcriptional regulator, HxlR family n=1 Tax=Ethanoligenens harbinense (strain DSM 18485 / JCM 12961 / CGMCC 1.5033 / YUAN-3) TaxID=663278 RepID=E6U3Q0_ETHHY|nr:helix-turn-helix domain-containing protein [Ethanoligenens harbinense]ADU27650.1 transcriptional regulator, HxlR family [Ethanoligenens harbinense YUAN-3]AVQ96686.1 transcriptional regulator [Ethanoligenens harbinense YUAN-3]AYF39346.1 transcriptional regulator [Ethanoligenens harbinense]AYF42171.1 transcriptional regulator [Ethanoligenens harbinense]QCN92926.1 transcriptional regulator [Ethanoligenens harbinense]